MAEIKVAVISNVDMGKSTTIATLTFDILDDGRGEARKRVLYHPHEQETGRTSSITKTFMQIADGNYINFIDLAGHEKYLRTTLHGITGYEADYAMLVVGANMGVSRMVKEHLSVVTSLKIPVFVVVTKLDICPPEVLEETKRDIEKLLQKTRRYKFINHVKSIDHVDQTLDCYREKVFDISPIFYISNKTGEGLPLLRDFVMRLPVQTHYITPDKITSTRKIFRIHEKFHVEGIGIVVSGQVIEGIINKGDILSVGVIKGQWMHATVKSIHDNFQNEVDRLLENESGCIAIKFHDKKVKVNKWNIKKGSILADKHYDLTKRFKALIMITTGHATTVKVGYQPIINCKTIVQAAKIFTLNKADKEGAITKTEEDGTKVERDEAGNVVLRAGELALADFKFMYRPEFLNEGDIFIFREGNLRGLGKVRELVNDERKIQERRPPNKRRERRKAATAAAAKRAIEGSDTTVAGESAASAE